MKSVELTHDKKLQFFGWLSLLFGLFVLIKPMTEQTFVWSFETSKIIAYSVVFFTSITFVFVGAYLLLMVFNSKLEFDENEMRYQSEFRRKVVAPWSSIRSVTFGEISHEILIITDFGNIKVHNMIGNFHELIKELERRGICIQ